MSSTPDNSVKVDHQDGGPGSHTQDGGDTNDVASGGTTEAAREEEGVTSPSEDRDLHGEPDTVA